MSTSKTTSENEQIQAQIGVSISLARNLVASWLPPLTDEERKLEVKRSGGTSNVLAKRRAPRAGLGSTGEKDDNATLSIEEMKIKRKLMQKEKRLTEQDREQAKDKAVKRHLVENSEDEEDESVRRKGQKKTKQNAHETYLSAADKKSRKGFGR